MTGGIKPYGAWIGTLAGAGAIAVLLWNANDLATFAAANRVTGINSYLFLERCLLLACALVIGSAIVREATGRKVSNGLVAAGGSAIGLIVFIQIIGIRLVVPTDTQWISGGDWAQHYLGWEFFRRDDWHWPLGASTRLPYPVGTSVVYTDSTPLWALVLKPFGALLPPAFQYIGWNFLVAWLLQGLFTALLARQIGLSVLASLLCAALLTLQPVLMLRIGHDSLTWHWILLAGLLLYFSGVKQESSIRQLAAGAVALCAVAALVHPYLAVMALLLITGLVILLKVQGRLRRLEALGLLGVCVLVTLFFWELSGAFIVKSVGDWKGVQLGKYSSNLLALFDGTGISPWAPGIEDATGGQYEGRAYPGVGGWLVMGAGVGLFFWRRRHRWSFLWPLCTVVLAAWLFALSPKVAMGGTVLFDLSAWAPPALEAFHSSGRFAWVLLYGLLAIGFFGLAILPRVATVLLSAALLLQVAEFRPFHHYAATLRSGQRPVEHPRLEDERWKSIGKGARHLVAIPPQNCGTAPADYFPLAVVALENELTFNSAYLARVDRRAIDAYCAALNRQIEAKKWDRDAVYVVAEPYLAHFAGSGVSCQNIETLNVCRLDPAETSSSTPE